MVLRGLLCLSAILISLADAIPTIAFPLNSQLPPIARISKPFSYTFSSSTFSSPLPITYTLSYGPSWLTLDASSRTLSGIPSAHDAGPDTVTGVALGLTATDSTGSTTLNATIVISRSSGPVVNIQPSSQLQSFAAFSAPSTLLYHPSTPFHFTFDPNTFTESGGLSNLSYYAVAINNTPLPAWIQFDEASLTFSGQTPDYQSLIQPPQTFGLQVIASDVQGFSGASLPFYIEVGIHLLAFTNANLVINATAGSQINFSGLADTLQLDGQTLQNTDLTSVTAKTPDWMTFDRNTYTLRGLVPNDASSCNVTVQATDVYGDIANVVVLVNIPPIIFAQPLPNLNVTIGSEFSYDIGVYLQNKSDIEISANFTPAEPWCHFDAQTFNMTGKVPTDFKPLEINVTLNATSKALGISKSQAFKLSVNLGPSTTGSQQSHASTAPNTSATGTAKGLPSSPPGPRKLSKGVWIAIFMPIGLLLLVLLVALLCCYRCRKAERYVPPPSKGDISGPLEAAASSISIIITPPRVPPPEPLPLDMSRFGQRTSAMLSFSETQNGIATSRPEKSVLRRSKTIDVSDHLRVEDTASREMAARSYSDNALDRIGSGWRWTPESAYLSRVNLGRASSRGSGRLSRTFSNYSRKGHQRRSAITSIQDLKERGRAREIETSSITRFDRGRRGRETPTFITRGSGSILGLGDGSLGSKPGDNYSIMSRPREIRRQLPAESIYSVERTSTRPQSRLLAQKPTLASVLGPARRPSLGHGGKGFSTTNTSLPRKRVSIISNGQEWTPQGLNRESQSWLTVTANSNEAPLGRHSIISASSEYDDFIPRDRTRMSTIRKVTKSPSIHNSSCLSENSGNSRLSRPISRRVGSSPLFFAGESKLSNASSSHRSPPRKRSKKKNMRTSYADSPTVPEEEHRPVTRRRANTATLEEKILHGLREEEEEGIDRDPRTRDSFGISYGMAKEGTRQLRSYFQSQFGRSETGDSLCSNDSRFKSANSLQQQQE